MSDSNRQLYFADFVIELQAIEDDKRRRIRDARRRAEKAQREAFLDLLNRLATEGKIRPHTRWRDIEGIVVSDESFPHVQAQGRDAPRELYETFSDDWDLVYRKERAFLARVLDYYDRNGTAFKAGTTLEEFRDNLLKAAEHSVDMYGETRRIIQREDPVSSAQLYFEELTAAGNGSNSAQANRRRSLHYDSSEDEGEIVEEGEVVDSDPLQEASNTDATSNEHSADNPRDCLVGDTHQEVHAASDGREEDGEKDISSVLI